MNNSSLVPLALVGGIGALALLYQLYNYPKGQVSGHSEESEKSQSQGNPALPLQFPLELNQFISSQLKLKDFIVCEQVCKAWQRALHENALFIEAGHAINVFKNITIVDKLVYDFVASISRPLNEINILDLVTVAIAKRQCTRDIFGQSSFRTNKIPSMSLCIRESPLKNKAVKILDSYRDFLGLEPEEIREEAVTAKVKEFVKEGLLENAVLLSNCRFAIQGTGFDCSVGDLNPEPTIIALTGLIENGEVYRAIFLDRNFGHYGHAHNPDNGYVRCDRAIAEALMKKYNDDDLVNKLNEVSEKVYRKLKMLGKSVVANYYEKLHSIHQKLTGDNRTEGAFGVAKIMEEILKIDGVRGVIGLKYILQS